MPASNRTRESSVGSSISPATGRKKRLACDNCHLSKVRCTGEDGGCQRCKRGQKKCHYSESNMGRTPLDGPSKRRRRSFQAASGSPPIDPTGPFHRQRHQSNSSPSRPFIVVRGAELRNETDLTSSTGGKQASPYHDVNLLDNDDMRMWNQQGREQDASHSTLLDNIGIHLPSPGFDKLLSNFEDIDYGYIDDSHFEISESPSDLPYAAVFDHHSPQVSAFPHQEHQQQCDKQQLPHSSETYQRPLPTPTSDKPTTGSENQLIGSEQLDGAHINFWAAQLEKLSCLPHAGDSPIPLDEMLHHSSQLFSRVTETLQKFSPADASSSSTNLILILVCLTQTISLFERCLPSLICGPVANGPSTGLSLHLGAYQIDQKVQQALQMHVVVGELSKVLDICRLIKQSLSQPGWAADSKRTHGLLLEDLQVRTKTLAYQMKQKSTSGRRIAL